MSTRERYIKVIESLVNGEEAQASDLLHEAFVEKAREIWNDLVEADEVVEDEVAEEEIDEAISDEKADDFIGDIEEDDEEIEAEEMFGEDEDGEDAPESDLSDQKLKWNYQTKMATWTLTVMVKNQHTKKSMKKLKIS